MNTDSRRQNIKEIVIAVIVFAATTLIAIIYAQNSPPEVIPECTSEYVAINGGEMCGKIQENNTDRYLDSQYRNGN